MRITGWITLVFLAAIILSCSSSQSIITAGNTADDSRHQYASQHREAKTQLWGIWDISLDLASQSLDAVPLRTSNFTCNVLKFLETGKTSKLILEDLVVKPGAGYTDVGVKVGLIHPFPAMNVYTGFDVLGVFMGNGSVTYQGGTNLKIAGEADQRLLNPDGYTRWFNAQEFSMASMPLFGYTPGKLGYPGYVPTAQINPYKYFADGLSANEDAFNWLLNNYNKRGSFTPGSTNKRHYDIRFPDSVWPRFQYAVIAHWEHPGTSNPGLSDFPPEANSDESLLIAVEDSSTLYYKSPSNFGGKVILDIRPWDWSAVQPPNQPMQEYSIKLYSSAWSGAYNVDMMPTGSGVHNYTYHAEVIPSSLTSNKPITVWIEIIYPELDYSNDYGVPNQAAGNLTSYFPVSIPVGTQEPSWISVTAPNGGESLEVGSAFKITWNNSATPEMTSVTVEYSKNDFLSDINVIGIDDPNDGSLLWSNIPDEPSDTVKVRVKSTSNPAVFDISDDYFSIVPKPIPTITVVKPNGGEKLFVGLEYEITWNSKNLDGTVSIHYSKDNFVSDINLIAKSENNDGSYQWDVPDDESDTVRVRVMSDVNNTIFDISDNDFSIVDDPCLDFEMVKAHWHSGINVEWELLIKDQTSWNNLVSMLGWANPPQPDWTTQMAFAVFMGWKSNSCYRLSVKDICIDELGILHINYYKWYPGPKCNCLDVISTPYMVVITERYDGAYQFNSQLKEDPC